MTLSDHSPERHNPTRAVAALLLMFALLGSLLGPSSSSAKATSAVPLDLAAMAPTAADLEADGFEDYVSWAGGSAGSEGSLSFNVGNWTDECCYVGKVQEGLAAAGFRRTYPFALTTADPDDPRFAARGVYGSINEFADEDGAADGLAVLEEMSGVDSVTVERVQDATQLGDASLLVRETDYQQLTIAVQLDRLLVFIRIRDFKEVPPDVSEIEAVAERLLGRIDAQLDGDAPGLGNLVLRLADDEYQSPYEYRNDQYDRLAGEDRQEYAESVDEYSNRVDATGDAIDAYRFSQFIQGADAQHPEFPNQMYWMSTVYRFSDDAAASDWLEDRSNDLEISLRDRDNTKIRDIDLLDDAQVLGDESFTVVYNEVETGSCGCTSQIVRIHSRVGSIVVDVQLGTLSEPSIPVEAVEALATFQVDCLVDANCVDPVLMSDALSGQASSDFTDKVSVRLEGDTPDVGNHVAPATSR